MELCEEAQAEACDYPMLGQEIKFHKKFKNHVAIRVRIREEISCTSFQPSPVRAEPIEA